MSKNTSNASNGNDGTWFLEAVGAMPKAPTPSEAIAKLEEENTLPGEMLVTADVGATREEDLVEFDGDPGTSTSSFHPVERQIPTPEPAASHGADYSELDDLALAEAPGPSPTPDDDTQLAPVLRSRRNFRWPIVIILLLLIGGVAVAALVVPRQVESAAVEHRQLFYDAAAGVRGYLPDSQGALDAITNPAADNAAVSAAVPTIAELDTRAFALQEAASEPLPTTLPLIPAPEVDALEPFQDRAVVLGASSSVVARRLGNGYVYRTSIPLLLQPGDLPTEAETQEINEISVRLAESLATDAGIVADLPDDPSFTATRVLAVETIDRYAEWQQDYLGALAGEDGEAATLLISEFDALLADLEATTTADLLGFRSTLDASIVELAGQLDRYLADVSAT